MLRTMRAGLAGVVLAATGCNQLADIHEGTPREQLARRVIHVSVGDSHTCAIASNGSAKCWGNNDFGKLGLGDAANRGDGPNQMGNNLPAIDLGTGKTASAIAAGGNHTCALLNNGSMRCWGYNFWGQLGMNDALYRGDKPNEMGDNMPIIDLGTGKSASAIAAGYAHTCALLNDGSVKCWGRNEFGQLGLGDTVTRGDGPEEMGDNLLAIDLGTGRTASAVVASFEHTCALLNDNSVKCWGNNHNGQLGLGNINARGDGPNEMGDNLPAIDLGTGKTAFVIVAGESHTCALLNDGSVKCWGYNGAGQLGLNDTADRGDQLNEMGDNLPALNFDPSKTASALGAGSRHTCAILNDGSIKCWGYNGAGQLGLGDHDSRGYEPKGISNNQPVIDLGVGKSASTLAAGGYQTCAILNGGSVKCWGDNTYGQLGLGDILERGGEPNQMGDNLPAVQILDLPAVQIPHP